MTESRYLTRGKRIDNGEWVIGLRCKQWISPRGLVDAIQEIISTHESIIREIDPETVGQCTGLRDKDGTTYLFEHDIINKNGIKVGNYHENADILKDTANMLIEKMGTRKWLSSEQEAIKRGCFYAE